jgi:hypothetical protein
MVVSGWGSPVVAKRIATEPTHATAYPVMHSAEAQTT